MRFGRGLELTKVLVGDNLVSKTKKRRREFGTCSNLRAEYIKLEDSLDWLIIRGRGFEVVSVHPSSHW